MSAQDALTGLGERTAQAVRGVLEPFCPGQVHVGDVRVLAATAEPLADFPTPSVATTVSAVDGGTVLVLTLAGAKRLAAALMGMQEPAAAEVLELDELELSAVSEAMNQALAAGAGAMSAVLGTEVEAGPPVTRVLRAGEPAPEDHCPPTRHATATGLSVLGEQALLVQRVPDSFTLPGTAALEDLGIRVDVAGVRDAGPPALGGITMRLTAELGRARMNAGHVVGLPAGTVVELDADVDAPIDLLVNGVPFARTRLLVTDDGEWAVEVEELVLPHPHPSPG